MSYQALWLRGEEVAAEEQFADLFAAKQHIMAALRSGGRDDITTVKVVSRGRTFFTISPPHREPSRDRSKVASATPKG